MKEASFDSEKFLEISRVALALRPDFAMIAGVEFLLPSVPLGGAGSYSSAGAICPNLCTQLFEACVAGEWRARASSSTSWSRLWDLFRDQYPVVPQGRHGDHGTPGRAHAPAAADRHQGAPGAHIRAQLEDLGILDSEPHGW